jgi:uncharacterized zinc-type alcohol dehydrogenase-like protein
MYKSKAFAANSASSPLTSATISRRDPKESDVQIEILFCGVCHSDLHQARNEWSGVMPTVYPCVPGHEIVGRVTKVGMAFRNSKLEILRRRLSRGLGPDMPRMQGRLEQFCANLTLTYNFPDKHLGGVTYGGYSDSIVVDQKFVLRVPSNLNLAGAGAVTLRRHHDLFPMRHWGVASGKKVGVVGLGGLGHMV